MTDIPTVTAWDRQEGLGDETRFTPWAKIGWSSWNGQSPELEVCDFAATLADMMQPQLVIETGVGQGYMTRALAEQLCPPQMLVSYESNLIWREAIWSLPFWQRHRFFVRIAAESTPGPEMLEQADLCVFDSDFEYRLNEIVAWDYWAKPGAVALVHDTADRDGTVHQSIRDLIQELGMTGVFLQNPRGAFMAVQPAKEKTMPVTYSEQSEGPSTRRAAGEQWAEGGGGTGAAVTSSSQMTKAELQALAAERGLATSGTKNQLIDRLAGVGS